VGRPALSTVERHLPVWKVTLPLPQDEPAPGLFKEILKEKEKFHELDSIYYMLGIVRAY
jgi:hypothetical protein